MKAKFITAVTLGIGILICTFIGILSYNFSAGSSNSIYFDIKNQAIIGCNGTISNLSIISKDYNDDLNFRALPSNKGKSSFSIKKLDTDYSIQVTSTLIDLQNFKLRPDMEYEIINHSDKDRDLGKVIIQTDKNGTVCFADKTNCD